MNIRWRYKFLELINKVLYSFFLLFFVWLFEKVGSSYLLFSLLRFKSIILFLRFIDKTKFLLLPDQYISCWKQFSFILSIRFIRSNTYIFPYLCVVNRKTFLFINFVLLIYFRISSIFKRRMLLFEMISVDKITWILRRN